MVGDVESCQACPLNGCSVGDSARGWGVTVDAVGSRAEHSDVLAGNFLRAVERKMLVTASGSGVAADLHRDLAAGDDARPGNLALHPANASEQGVRGLGVVPAITPLVNFYGNPPFRPHPSSAPPSAPL